MKVSTTADLEMVWLEQTISPSQAESLTTRPHLDGAPYLIWTDALEIKSFLL